MEKATKSARELESMILTAAADCRINRLNIRRDRTAGWLATVVTGPRDFLDAQRRVDVIASSLRGQFDLQG